MKELVEYLVKNIVDEPEQVTVEERTNEGVLEIVVQVSEADTGKIIGKNGRVIKAIRTLVKNIAQQKRINANVVIEDRRLS